MDTFHDCQQCHGRYRWIPSPDYADYDNGDVDGIEVCRDCGHKRKIKTCHPQPRTHQ